MKRFNHLFFSFCLVVPAGVCAQEFQEVKKPDVKVNEYRDKDTNMFVADCNTDLEFDEDNGLVFHTKSQRPFTGRCRSYYEDNSPERVVNFIDGKEDGTSMTWYKSTPESPTMQLMVRTNHDRGVPVGMWEFYYENGQKAWIQNYKQGLLDGKQSYFYENGKPKKEESYINNVKDGLCKEWYPTKEDAEKLKSEITYKNGIMDGTYKTYYENGQVQYQGKYTAGKEDGEVVTYYENGNMKTQLFYKAGQSDGEWRTWYDDGHEKSIMHFVKGKKNGEVKEFYKDGQLKKMEKWVEGKRTDIEAYDEFGNKLDPDEIKD